MTKHVRKWKEAQVQELQQLAGKYPVIAVASLQNFPSELAAKLRKHLHTKAVVKVSKTRVIKKALEASKVKGVKELLPHAKGSIAVIFTEMNPFELFAFIKRNKGSVAAKPGMIAPEDIIVPAGDTGITPGPALSDLKAAGLKTVVKGPTISIGEDKVVAKKGETINPAAAGALSKLDIKPIKVGLGITAVVEKGQVYKAEVLDIDTEKTFEQFVTAHSNAFNLAIEICYPTKETIEHLLSRAFRNAKSVSLEASILNSSTSAEILAKTKAQADALKSTLKEPPPHKGKKEEKPAEGTKKEKPAEGEKKEKPAEGEKKEKPAGEKREEKKEEKPAEEKKEQKPAPEKKKESGAKE